MQTPSTQRANAPDAFESQSDRTGDDVHDSVPLSALANIARSPGGVRSASKGGRNYAWTNTESLAALLAREGANTKEQREKADVRAKECQRRFICCLRVVESTHAELARKNIPGPYSPIVYRKANVAMTATPLQAATQRGGYEGKSVLLRGDAIHACVVKHILPAARRTYTHRESGINWMDVSAAVSAHVDALLTADPPLGKTDRDLLSAAHYAWRWTCPENPDVVASATLAKNALTTFTLTKTLARPSEAYPQNRAEQGSREASRVEAQRLAAAAMRATDSAQKREREDEASRASRHARRDRILELLEEELLFERAKRLRESHGFDDHRVGISASDASDADARAGGFTFAERLDRAEDEVAPTETAGERATDIARSVDPAISPEKENVPPHESGERDAQRAPCQTLGATTQAEVCVPSTDVTPECTPRRSGRASKPSVRLQRV